MLMCNETVTLFYGIYASGVMKWYKKVLHSSFLNNDMVKIRSKTGVDSKYTCKCIITDIDSYKYPKSFKALTDIEKQNYYTVMLSDRDFIVRGEVAEDITVVGDKAIKDKYECYTVKSVDVKMHFAGIHRLEVLGV